MPLVNVNITLDHQRMAAARRRLSEEKRKQIMAALRPQVATAPRQPPEYVEGEQKEAKYPEGEEEEEKKEKETKIALPPPPRIHTSAKVCLLFTCYVLALCAFSFLSTRLFFMSHEERLKDLQKWEEKSESLAMWHQAVANPECAQTLSWTPDAETNYGLQMMDFYLHNHTSAIVDRVTFALTNLPFGLNRSPNLPGPFSHPELNAPFETLALLASLLVVSVVLSTYVRITVTFLEWLVHELRDSHWLSICALVSYVCANMFTYMFLLTMFPEARADTSVTVNWLFYDVFALGRHLMLMCGVTDWATRRNVNRWVVPLVWIVVQGHLLVHLIVFVRLLSGQANDRMALVRQRMEFARKVCEQRLSHEEILTALRDEPRLADVVAKIDVVELGRRVHNAEERIKNAKTSRSSMMVRCTSTCCWFVVWVLKKIVAMVMGMTWLLYSFWFNIFERLYFACWPQNYVYDIVDSWEE